MQRPEIVAALDIGTNKVCCLIAEVKDTGEVEVIGFGQSPATGIRKGVIVSIESIIHSVQNAIEDARKMANEEIKEVATGIAAGHIRSYNSNAVIGVQRADKEITKADVDKVIENARAINIPADMEIIHLIPQEFIIDGQDGIKEPIGMSGVRLEVKVHIIVASTTAIQNLIKSVNRSGYNVSDIILQQLASAKAILSEEEKELGVALIDIGGGTTDIILYSNGGIMHTSVLPIGGDHITNDIAIGLRTPKSSAEQIKRKYGVASVGMVDNNEMITIPKVGDFDERQVPRLVLAEIIEPRVDEMLRFIKSELSRAGYVEFAPTGVVLTGGSSLLPGLKELASQIFEVPVRSGYPKNILGLKDIISKPMYSTGVGLLLYAAENVDYRKNMISMSRNFFSSFIEKIKQWFGDFF